MVKVNVTDDAGVNSMVALIMKLAMPVSPSPSLPRKR
jgi:hypothetical protein